MMAVLDNDSFEYTRALGAHYKSDGDVKTPIYHNIETNKRVHFAMHTSVTLARDNTSARRTLSRKEIRSWSFPLFGYRGGELGRDLLYQPLLRE